LFPARRPYRARADRQPLPANGAHGAALLPVFVAVIERETISDLFDDISVEVDLEFVHVFRMVAGNFGFAMEWHTLTANTVLVWPQNT
jgi:hypothetical protein